MLNVTLFKKILIKIFPKIFVQNFGGRITIIQAANNGPSLLDRSLDILRSAIDLFPDVFIKFQYIEKMLGTQDQPHIVVTALNIITIAVEHNLTKLVTEHLPALCMALTPIINTANPKVIVYFDFSSRKYWYKMYICRMLNVYFSQREHTLSRKI